MSRGRHSPGAALTPPACQAATFLGNSTGPVAPGMQRPPCMGPTPADRPSAPAGLRRAAVLTLLCFGCATVRVPASTIAETVPVRGGVAEPQLELWVESGGMVSPAESAEASAQARAALESALARVSTPQGDSLLVVRAQGVTRTPSRRSDQRAAVAGLVVGAVVVVAAVVVLVATQGKGGGGGGPKLARGARAPRPVPVPVRPVPHPGTPRPVPVFVGPASPRVDVGVYAGIDVPAPAPATPGHYVVEGPAERRDAQAPAPAWPPAEELAAVSLPPPSPLDLGKRGFFEGDSLRLELVVVDRRAGTPRWTKVVEAEVDPRDAQAVERLLARR